MTQNAREVYLSSIYRPSYRQLGYPFCTDVGCLLLFLGDAAWIFMGWALIATTRRLPYCGRFCSFNGVGVAGGADI